MPGAGKILLEMKFEPHVELRGNVTQDLVHSDLRAGAVRSPLAPQPKTSVHLLY